MRRLPSQRVMPFIFTPDREKLQNRDCRLHFGDIYQALRQKANDYYLVNC
ncbi:hypothetical protein ACOHYD_03595 [Desulfobacterota bacterium M19]